MKRLKFLGKFGTVGLLGTGVFFLLMWLLVERLKLSVMTATSIAFIIVVIENYVLHHRWTFSSDKQHTKALPQFLLMSGSGFFINGGIMYYGSVSLSMNYLLVQCLAILAVVLWNLTLSTQWVFSAK